MYYNTPYYKRVVILGGGVGEGDRSFIVDTFVIQQEL